jgi:formylglycine-generating enzyme required for sulfatase activity
MRMKIGWALAGVMVLVVAVGVARAQSVPQLINYQGRLTNATGQPPADGSTVDLTFKFYGVASGATAYLTVLQKNVVVTGGLYNVLIGSGTVTPGTEPTLAAVFQKHTDVWMGVKVDADAEMTPRARIASVPYALKVEAGWLTAFYNKSDYDGDGYAKVVDGAMATTDCNDGDASIHPGADEVCADGIDNDCDGLVDANDPDCWATSPGMALIPSGCFNMGDAFSEGYSWELPVHNVCITSSFYMDVNLVTNAEYAACVSGGWCTAPGNASSYSRASYYGNPTYNNFPVIYVNWTQATAYCTWSGKRLPTEAQWEYAARGGLSGKRYPWGDTATACVDGNFDYCIGDTSAVGSYPANGYGLYDVGGNVWEWVNDWYSDTYYSTSPPNNPPGPNTGTYRVLRGNYWYYDDVRVSFRLGLDPTGRDFSVGFRCSRD